MTLPPIRTEGELKLDAPRTRVRLDPEWPVRTEHGKGRSSAAYRESFHALPTRDRALSFPGLEGTDLRTMLSGKIHRATVTEANLNYEGSITLDPILMEAAGVLPYEKVHVLDITNGSRLETYAIQGRRGDGEACINGAAAHLVNKGDLVIILTYQQVSEEAALGAAPKHVYVDAANRIVRTSRGDGFAARARDAAGIA